MKMIEALHIIGCIADKKEGFMVSFERKEGNMLRSDHFPDKHAGEDLIQTEKEAWLLAKLFAMHTVGKCVNIYVVDHTFSPVVGYELKEIKNRKDSDADKYT